jgi:hypothetical protein
VGHISAVRLPRKGILVRLCIYVPVLSYVSWRAYERWSSEREAAAAPAKSELDEKLAPHKRIITLPDGRQQEIVELTPEQAEALIGPLPKAGKPVDDANPTDAPPKATP